MVNVERRAASSPLSRRATTRGRARTAVRGLVVALTALTLTGVTAIPATAGTPAGPASAGATPPAVNGPDAEYYQSVVTGIQPAQPGIEIRAGADGTLTLTNRTGRTVVVIGYAGEDYLRIGPSGAEENTASLSAGINADPQVTKPPKAGTTPQPATWARRSTQPTYTWHDLRVAWTNKQRPPIVQAAPHDQHTVFPWAVKLKVDNTPVLVLGEVRWTGEPWLTDWQTAALVVLVLLLPAAVGVTWLRRRRQGRSLLPTRGRHEPVEGSRDPVPTPFP